MPKPHSLSLYFAARGWVLAALCAVVVWSRVQDDAPLRPEFLVWVVAGMALRLWAGAHLGPHGNASRPEAPRLSRNGPYRYSRNPLYLSNLAVGAGLVLFANSLQWKTAVALLLALVLHHVILVNWEEANLRRQWEDAYAAYARAVPRWFGVRSAAGDGIPSASWKRTFSRQGRNLGYALLAVLILWVAGR